MPVTLTLEGLLVGFPLAAIAVELARRRWGPRTEPGPRRRRTVGLVVIAVVVVAAWPLVLFAVMMAGAFFVAVFVFGIRPVHPPSSRPQSPPPRPTPPPPPGGYGYAGWHHDPYEEERIREQTRAAIERDEEDRRVYEWDQYRWENRSHPPSGPELW